MATDNSDKVHLTTVLERIAAFTPSPDTNYLNDYTQIFQTIKENQNQARQIFRTLTCYDIWFLGYFVCGIEPMNHPWVVERCREAQEGPLTDTLDLWAREHFKSVLFTLLEPIQRKLRSFNTDKPYLPVFVPRLKPFWTHHTDERIGIFSFNKPIANSFLSAIRGTLETSGFLQYFFNDVLYENPDNESPEWKLDSIKLKRKGVYKESCFEAHGLIEGMPVGRHFTGMIRDDVVTQDNVHTAEGNQKVADRVEMSLNLGMRATEKFQPWVRTVGTIYRHDDPYVRMMNMKLPNGDPAYHVRVHPATRDGSWDGEPVLLSQKELDRKKTNHFVYATQQLLDPTPTEMKALSAENLVEVEPADIPKRLYYFMTVDQAGDKTRMVSRADDSWALIMCGVDPYTDDLGLSNLYILDAVIKPMGHDEAIKEIVRMYCKPRQVHRLGVEKAGLSVIDIHVEAALRRRNKIVTVDNNRLVVLRHGGRNKQFRVESALTTPLLNGNIHISKAVSVECRERLKMEMDKWPAWKNDGLDALSYQYDLIKDYKFPKRWTQKEQDEVDAYERNRRSESLSAFRRKPSGRHWLMN